MNSPPTFLLGETKRKVIGLLMEKRQTATDIASSLEIQVSAARKHLESMREMGLVTHEYVNLGVGRPKKVFALTESGREFFPNQYSNILNVMISKMLHAKEVWQVEEMVEDIAKEIGMQIRSEASLEDPKTISIALNRFGFESHVDRIEDGQEEDKLLIVSRNCPLFKVASKHQRLICHSFHGAILRSALSNVQVELNSCMATGASQCRHQVVSNSSITRDHTIATSISDAGRLEK